MSISCGSPWLLPPILAVLSFGFLAEVARSDESEPLNLVALFCGYGESDGAIKTVEFCGISGKKSSRFPRTYIVYGAAGGRGEPEIEDAPEITFSNLHLGLEHHPRLPVYGRHPKIPRLVLGVGYFRKTAYFAVEELGGLNVVGVEHGPSASAALEWPYRWLGTPLTTEFSYEWVPRAPKPETGGFAVSWGPLALTINVTNVQGQRIETTILAVGVPLGKR